MNIMNADISRYLVGIVVGVFGAVGASLIYAIITMLVKPVYQWFYGLMPWVFWTFVTLCVWFVGARWVVRKVFKRFGNIELIIVSGISVTLLYVFLWLIQDSWIFN